MKYPERVILDAETVYIYTVPGEWGIHFAYVGHPSPLFHMGTDKALSETIHDPECLVNGCYSCGEARVMQAIQESGCAVCGSIDHVDEEHDLLADTDDDWYGI